MTYKAESYALLGGLEMVVLVFSEEAAAAKADLAKKVTPSYWPTRRT